MLFETNCCGYIDGNFSSLKINVDGEDNSAVLDCIVACSQNDNEFGNILCSEFWH
jgi:hypothetical protein